MTDLKVGGTIYRRNGDPVVIIGETKTSWLIGGRFEWEQQKIKKSAMRKGNSGESGERWIQYFVDLQDALDCKFCTDHRYAIGKKVEDCWDGKVLRQIAALVGFVEPTPQK